MEGGVIRADCSQTCHWIIVSGRFSEYYYQSFLLGKQTSIQRAAATDEYFSFVYTKSKNATLFFLNYYSILRHLPADIRPRRQAVTAALLDCSLLGFLSFVELASLYSLVNKANSVHSFSQYVYFFSLQVSGDYVPIIRRNNCMYATLGTCYSETSG